MVIARIVKKLIIYWRDKEMNEIVTGKTTNEWKSDLIKRGYDVFCPICDKHFGLAEADLIITCPSCHYRWRVGMNGCPKVSVA